MANNYTSVISPDELVITAANESLYVQEAHEFDPNNPEQGYGLVERDFSENPFASLCAAYSGKVYSWAEIDARIEANEKNGTRTSDILQAKGFVDSNQSRTNYCWMHGCVNGMQGTRIIANMPTIELSAASAAAPCKNYRNSGGWGLEGLQWLSKYGVSTMEHWAPNAINKSLRTPEMQANALLHRVTDYEDLAGNDLQILFSALIDNLLCPVAYNWWSHLVCAVDPIKFGPNNYGVRILNSHGQGKFIVLEGRRAVPSDTQVIRVVTTSKE